LLPAILKIISAFFIINSSFASKILRIAARIPDHLLLDYPFFVAALSILLFIAALPIIYCSINISQIHISAFPIIHSLLACSALLNYSCTCCIPKYLLMLLHSPPLFIASFDNELPRRNKATSWLK